MQEAWDGCQEASLLTSVSGDLVTGGFLSVIRVVCFPSLFPLLPCASVVVLSRKKAVSDGEDLI